MKGLFIIPTYNEANNIRLIIPEILKQDENTDILVVDDNSPDGTSDVVKELMEKSDRIFLLLREKKMGLGRAYVAGFKWALEKNKYDYVCEIDADFSHDPNDFYRFKEKLSEGYDLIIGSRYKDGIRVLNWDMKRFIISIGGNLYARIATGINLTDLTGGYNCYSIKVLEKVNLDSISSSGYSFQIEMKANAVFKGFKVVEVPIVFRDRFDGTSKMSGGIFNEAFFKCWEIRFKHLFGKI